MDRPAASQSDLLVPASKASRRTAQQRMLRGLKLICIAYATVCLVLVLMETRLVFPGAYFDAPPRTDLKRFSPDRPTFDEISTLAYEAADGSELRGRLYLREGADRVVLFLHGNGIRAIDLDDWTTRLSAAMQATVLTAEYRGFQNDGFTPTESSTIADAVSAIDALADVTDVSVTDITIYGRSLGGGVAAGLAESMQERGTPPKSLILDRTFDSTGNVGADRYFLLPIHWLMRNQYDIARRLRSFQGNVVQIHGKPDRVVPMKNGRALFDTLTTPHKVWIEVPGMYHNDPMSEQTLGQAIEQLRALESGA